jgi:hypothetical protein
MSGDANTSLGNCLIVASVAIDLIRRLGIKAEVFNDGDDTVYIVEAEDVGLLERALADHFLRFGLCVESEPVAAKPEHFEFCQHRLVKVGTRYVFVRNPFKALSNDFNCRPKYNTQKQRDQRLWAVGMCGGHLSSGIPVLQSLYAQARSQGVRGDMGKTDVFEVGLGRSASALATREGLRLHQDPLVVPVSMDTRISFYEAYGLEPSIQIMLEQMRFDLRAIPGDTLTLCPLNPLATDQCPRADFSLRQYLSAHDSAGISW